MLCASCMPVLQGNTMVSMPCGFKEYLHADHLNEPRDTA